MQVSNNTLTTDSSSKATLPAEHMQSLTESIVTEVIAQFRAYLQTIAPQNQAEFWAELKGNAFIIELPDHPNAPGDGAWIDSIASKVQMSMANAMGTKNHPADLWMLRSQGYGLSRRTDAQTGLQQLVVPCSHYYQERSTPWFRAIETSLTQLEQGQSAPIRIEPPAGKILARLDQSPFLKSVYSSSGNLGVIRSGSTSARSSFYPEYHLRGKLDVLGDLAYRFDGEALEIYSYKNNNGQAPDGDDWVTLKPSCDTCC